MVFDADGYHSSCKKVADRFLRRAYKSIFASSFALFNFIDKEKTWFSSLCTYDAEPKDAFH
jgi:hypothetical protein